MAGRRSRNEQPRNTCRERQAGFSLLETLIAFMILSLALCALLPVYTNSLNAAHDVNARTLARLRLETLFAEVGATKPLRVGEQTGAFADGYSWRLQIEPYDPAEEGASVPVVAYKVTGAVSWRARGKDRSLSLTTLRLTAGEAE